jgi:competence protein ComGC
MQAPVDYAKGLAKAKQSAANAADASSLNQVSQAISMFQMDKGRFPKTLDELVQEKYLPKIPDAPAGMKIDYDATTGKAALVNQ